MERRQFGSTDMVVSALGFGGAEIGSGSTPEHAERLLGNALDAGINVIDTAECYGESESLIGQAVAHRRQDYYLFTKCGHARGLNGQIGTQRCSKRALTAAYEDCVQIT